MTPKIAILGAGANGAAIGADMVRAGHDVTLIEQWPAHVEAMRAHGVKVTTPRHNLVETTEVRAYHLCEVASLRERFDLVYMVLKSYDARWGAELIKPVLADDGMVIGLQNGMRHRDIVSILGSERTLGAVIEMGSNLLGPGDIERHVPRDRSWFSVGSEDPIAHARAEEAAAVLRAAGTVEVIDDIEAAKWMKLVLNASQLVPSGILDRSIVEAASLPSMRPLMIEAGLEALRAVATHGVGLRPIMGMTDVDPNDPRGYLEQIFELLLNGFALPTTKATMVYDWRHGRRSEAGDINGEVVRTLGAQQAPVNAAAAEIAYRIEAGILHPDPSNEALLNELIEQYRKG